MLSNEKSHTVVIEASGVTNHITAGLRVFIRLWKKLKDKGHALYICNLKPYINQVLELLGFDRVIDFHYDVESAFVFAGNKA